MMWAGLVVVILGGGLLLLLGNAGSGSSPRVNVVVESQDRLMPTGVESVIITQGVPTGTSPALTSSPARGMTITLSEQNDSGESGEATLEESAGKVTVALNLTGAPAKISQPAHIHTGTCDKPGSVKYALSFPVNGKSETTLNVSLADLKTQLPLVLNVHESTEKPEVYVACGVLEM